MAFTDDFVMTVEEGGAVVGEAAAPDDEDDEMLDVFFGLPASGSIRPIGTHAPGECARPQPRLSFASLKLSRPLLKAVESAGFDEPTRVQELAIPVIMSGGDVCATAITGSGKTAAFMLPVLERLLVRTRRSASTAALVLLPTRELGMQCHAMTSRLAKYTSVQTALVVGGLSLKAQEAELRSRPDIVIGTPGRLIDLVRNSQAVTLESVEVLVLDEADRLLELGFRAELDEIIKMTPRGRQTLLFTATLSPAVEQLIAASLNRPTTVKVNEDMGVAGTLVQEFVRVHSDAPGGTAQPFGGVVLGEHLAQAEREAALLSLCTRSFTEGVLVFTRSRTQAHRLATLMRACELKARAARERARARRPALPPGARGARARARAHGTAFCARSRARAMRAVRAVSAGGRAARRALAAAARRGARALSPRRQPLFNRDRPREPRPRHYGRADGDQFSNARDDPLVHPSRRPHRACGPRRPRHLARERE